MADRLRIGVAGCGEVARRVHLPLLSKRSDVQLVALVDSNQNLLAETALRFRGVQAYARLEDMLAEATLDAVVVALPPALHAAAATMLFDAGLSVYLEKPLATTLADGAAVLRAWQRSGRAGVMGFNCRANPLNVQLRDLIRAGRAGSIVHLRTVFAVAPGHLPSWKGRRDTGGGVLLDLAVHHVDLIRFLTGSEITGVRASVASRRSEQDTALLELQLENGVSTQSFFSLAASEVDHVEVHGDAARLAVARFTSLDVSIVDNPGRGPGPAGRIMRRASSIRHLGRALAARRAPWREPGYAILLDRFIQAVRTGTRPEGAPDMADGFACTAVIAAAEQSLASGRLEKPAAQTGLSKPLSQATS